MEFLKKKYYNKIIKKKIIKGFLILLLLLLNNNEKNEKYNEINFFNKFIKICKNLQKLSHQNINLTKYPFLSICIPVYNMKKYIERAILSILNQFFNDFEIIIINDYSNDLSEYIIKRMQLENSQIKIINHKKNKGVYASRVDGILNAKGEYIMFLDPDDLFLNPYLFQKLFEYNLNYSLDIIEFTVFEENEGKNNLYYPSFHRANHYHNFKKKIIFQPELSNILFLDPEKNNYSEVICRPIWNKMIRKNIILQSIKFIGKYYYNNVNFNFAEDTILNILNFQLGSNYSNINLAGYMYNIREKSLSHGDMGNIFKFSLSYNILIYFQILYKYIKYFNKDRNYLFYDVKSFSNYLTFFLDLNESHYINETKIFFKNILNDIHISNDFKSFVFDFILKFK